MGIKSAINLNLSQVPELGDSALYDTLLEIHNALEILAARGSTANLDFNAYITKLLTVTAVNTDYAVTLEDGLILVSANLAAITITLPLAALAAGLEFKIKCIDNTFTVIVIGSEAIDDEVAGIELNIHDSITVKSDGVKWWII